MCLYVCIDTWQVRMKALCVIEAVLQRKEEAFNTYFKGNSGGLEANAQYVKPNVRAKARKCLGINYFIYICTCLQLCSCG